MTFRWVKEIEGRGWQTFSVKGQIVGHTASAVTTNQPQTIQQQTSTVVANKIVFTKAGRVLGLAIVYRLPDTEEAPTESAAKFS